MRDFTNKTFGYLTVIGEAKKRNERQRYALCKCHCGKEKEVRIAHLINGNTVSCGCKHHKTKKDSLAWKGHEEVSGDFMGIMRRNSKKRQNEFEITAEDVWNQYVLQDKKCYFTGLDIKFNNGASVDRIDNKIGYTKTNIRIVHKDINYMRRILADDKFIEYCKLIAKKFDNQ